MKLVKQNLAAVFLLAAIVLIALGTLFVSQVRAYISADSPAITDRVVSYKFFASSTPNAAPTNFATTTSATSTDIASWIDDAGRLDNGAFNITGAKAVTWYFSRGGATGPNTGTSTFRVEVSDNGTNWSRYYKLVSNVTNSNSQNLTRVETVAIEAATSTTITGMDLTNDSFKFVRCIVAETIDGDHSCRATARF